MANVSLRNTSNLLTILPKRYASAAAAAQAKEPRQLAPSREPLRVTKLENGTVVASIENHSPVTRIAAVVNAGSRDEAAGQQGVAHALRAFSSLATRNYSQFGVSRTLNQIGAELSVNGTREQTVYLLENTRNQSDRAVDVLGEIVSRPELRRWEIEDNRHRLEFDLDVYDEQPELRISDLIHKASFKNALSNSLYAPRYNVDNIDCETIRQFRNRTFTANNLSLVGVGINHDQLVRYAEFFRLPAGNATRQAAKYIGGEIRDENLNELVHLALSSEGASLGGKDFLVSGIVAHLFGTVGSRINYSSNNGRLARAVLGQAANPAAVSAFNANYTDTGLFGFHVVANKTDVGKIARGVFAEVAKTSKNGVLAEEVNAAKNSLKSALAFSVENSSSLVEAIGQNVEHSNLYSNLNELFKAVDAVPASDINAFVKRLATGKSSLAAIGDLSELPRLEELRD